MWYTPETFNFVLAYRFSSVLYGTAALMKVFYFIGVRPANQQWKRRGGSIFYPRDHCKTLIRGRSDESRSFSGIPESRILFAFDVGGGPASIRSNYIHVRAHVHNFCWRSTPLPEAVTRSCMFHPAISLSLSIYLPTYLYLFLSLFIVLSSFNLSRCAAEKKK